MKVVSPLLKKVAYPALSSAGVFRRTSASGLAVVTYHGVKPTGYQPVDSALDGNLVTAETLRRQLRMLKAHYDVVAPEDVLAWRRGDFQLPRRAVLLTCDDGLLNCLTDMLPVLEEEQVRCLFFATGASAGQTRATFWYEELFLMLLRAPAGPFAVSAGRVELRGELGSREQRRAIWWDTVKRLSRIDARGRASVLRALQVENEWPKADLNADELDGEDSPACRRYGLLTGGELRKLIAAGMTIGAHTMSHPMLSQMPIDLAYAEISESRAALESALQVPVRAFAYPFGDAGSVTPDVLAMPQRAGFNAAFLNYGGGLGVDLPPYALHRIHVTAEMSLPEFEAHVSGFYARLQRRAGRKPQAVEMVRASR
ncbi:MAG: polysaccharide deacetylase family protein [Candidatus Sulfotelmatobacter sp.]